MACITAPTAILASGAISGGSGILSGILGSSAASSAAKTQSKAAQQAAQLQAAIYQLTREDLAPYRSIGEKSADYTYNLLQPGGYLDTSQSPTWQPTMQQLESTPGYQFTLQQGEKAAQNFMTSQGLGQSGAAGIANLKYAQGLAETTYQDQFTNWLNQQKLSLSQKGQLYNMLGGLTSIGESAAAGTANAGITTGSAIGSDITSGAASTAAGTVGSTNAITSALSSLSGAGSNTALLLALNNAGMFGTSKSLDDYTNKLTAAQTL